MRESGCKGTTNLSNTKIFQRKNSKKTFFNITEGKKDDKTEKHTLLYITRIYARGGKIEDDTL